MAAASRFLTASYGRAACWVDAGNLVRISDGLTQQEIGFDIRPSLASLDQAQAQLAVHSNGRDNWLALLDVANSRIYPYNWDTKQWMPPWDSPAGLTAIASGEAFFGIFRFYAASSSGKVLIYLPGSYQDDGQSYASRLTLNLVQLAPDAQASQLQVLERVGLEHNEFAPSVVSQMVDDYNFAAMIALPEANKAPDHPPLRLTGTGLIEDWWYSRSPACKRVSVRLEWPAEATLWHLYSVDLVYYPVQA
jgi:hypothetical protein